MVIVQYQPTRNMMSIRYAKVDFVFFFLFDVIYDFCQTATTASKNCIRRLMVKFAKRNSTQPQNIA
jgi:hypothetical protein